MVMNKEQIRRKTSNMILYNHKIKFNDFKYIDEKFEPFTDMDYFNITLMFIGIMVIILDCLYSS